MVPTKSARHVYATLDSGQRACEARSMREAARSDGQLLWLVLGLAALSLWASLLACRGPRSEEGAGGQSGDEGRRPRLEGVGGSAAEPPRP